MPKEFIDFDSVWSVVLFTLITGGFIFMRYVLVSLVFYGVFSVMLKERFAARRISAVLRLPGQGRREVLWSAITSFIFAVSGTGMLWLYETGRTAIYLDPFEYGLAYIPVSILITMLLHETYYYFLHRWMHRPGVFRHFHRTHHESIVTSAWTAFSFHPIESVLQALIIPAIVLVLPLHIGAVLFLLTLMTISATINHLHIELYPKGFYKHPLGRWLIGASHHSLHHSQYRFNYGLYFTFYDRWLGTESPDYVPLFEQKTGE